MILLWRRQDKTFLSVYCVMFGLTWFDDCSFCFFTRISIMTEWAKFKPVVIWFPSVSFQHFSKLINRVGWLDDRHGPSPILCDTAPIVVYTDQLLHHWISFALMFTNNWFCLMQWLLIVLLLVGWVIWNSKPLNQSPRWPQVSLALPNLIMKYYKSGKILSNFQNVKTPCANLKPYSRLSGDGSGF